MRGTTVLATFAVLFALVSFVPAGVRVDHSPGISARRSGGV